MRNRQRSNEDLSFEDWESLESSNVFKYEPWEYSELYEDDVILNVNSEKYLPRWMYSSYYDPTPDSDEVQDVATLIESFNKASSNLARIAIFQNLMENDKHLRSIYGSKLGELKKNVNDLLTCIRGSFNEKENEQLLKATFHAIATPTPNTHKNLLQEAQHYRHVRAIGTILFIIAGFVAGIAGCVKPPVLLASAFFFVMANEVRGRESRLKAGDIEKVIKNRPNRSSK